MFDHWHNHTFYLQEGRDDARMRPRSDHRMISKIHNALDLIRNATCEVPFIAFYRKEEVQPELNITDLWKVYSYDEKVSVLFFAIFKWDKYKIKL